MAKCNLSIELANPDAIHDGGGKIHGVVRVAVDADVNCSGLEVQSVWRTHGRGNVASGVGESATLFSGKWSAGKSLEYPFELSIANWPPTYHGHYLNVDHYIDARAKIPWGFDPKTSTPFRMRPTGGSEASSSSGQVQAKGIVGGIVGGIVAAIALAIFVSVMIGFAMAGPFALIFLLLPLIGLLIWFFRTFLPRWALGEIQCSFPAQLLRPGEATDGQLTIRPKKNVRINEISLLLRGREECVSGSGSNRTTHTHVLVQDSETLQDATTLNAGVQHQFPCSVTIPADAAYSLDLDDNKLIWSLTLRVDIPKWPDWVKEVPLTVAPTVMSTSMVPGRSSVRSGSHGEFAARDDQPTVAATHAVDDIAEGSEGVSFAETVSHLWKARERRDQVDLLVEAVSGLPFEIEAEVERRLLYSGDDDPHVYRDGYAVWAHYPEPPLPMVLYVPHRLADDFEQIGRERWRGRGVVVGWDRQHGRLQVRLE